jgi:OOP family OmpA-OmpF porin
MKKIILTTIAVATLLVASNNEYKYEISPMISKVDTASNVEHETQNAFGLSLGINQDEKCILDQIELGFLRSDNVKYKDLLNESTDITRIFVNGVKEYKIADKTKLYALAGLGYEETNNALLENDGGIFGTIGVGIKYALTKTFSLKADVRELVLLNGDSNTIYTVGFAIPFGKKQPLEPKKTPITKMIDDDRDGHEAVVAKADLEILFETDKSIVRDQFNSKLTKYVDFLKANPSTSIILEAHTDSISSDKYNLALSQRRANSTKQALVNMGIDASRIKAIGYGESKPRVANDTAENRALNRRVTATIVK